MNIFFQIILTQFSVCSENVQVTRNYGVRIKLKSRFKIIIIQPETVKMACSKIKIIHKPIMQVIGSIQRAERSVFSGISIITPTGKPFRPGNNINLWMNQKI